MADGRLLLFLDGGFGDQFQMLRWQKKRDEAEVAEAGGNAKKAAKLRAEAGAMFAQDWLRAFPGDAVPAY